MPLLMRPDPVALDSSPPQSSRPLEEIHGPWCVARTPPKREKALARYLASPQVDLDYFLPYLWHRHENRTFSLVPLFSGFVFVCLLIQDQPGRSEIACYLAAHADSNQNRNPLYFLQHPLVSSATDLLRQSSHCSSLIHEPNQVRLQNELLLLASDPPDARTLRLTSRRAFRRGQPLTLTAGPFRGFPARFLNELQPHDPSADLSQKPRIAIELHTLGRIVSLEVDREWVAPTESEGQSGEKVYEGREPDGKMEAGGKSV